MPAAAGRSGTMIFAKGKNANESPRVHTFSPALLYSSFNGQASGNCDSGEHTVEKWALYWYLCTKILFFSIPVL